MNIEKEEGGPVAIFGTHEAGIGVPLMHYKNQFYEKFFEKFGHYIKYKNDMAYITLSDMLYDISSTTPSSAIGGVKRYAHRTYALAGYLKNDYFHAKAKCEELISHFLFLLEQKHKEADKAPICLRWSPTFNWVETEPEIREKHPEHVCKVMCKVRLSFIHPNDEIEIYHTEEEAGLEKWKYKSVDKS